MSGTGSVGALMMEGGKAATMAAPASREIENFNLLAGAGFEIQGSYYLQHGG